MRTIMPVYEKGIALVFEVSQGCIMGCQGCQINKELSGTPPEHKLNMLLELVSDLKDSKLTEFEFGPTDMVRARNREELLQHPKIKQLAGHFEMLTLNASFVYTEQSEYVDLAKAVNAFNTSKYNGLQIPLNLKHLYNDKYVQLIETNLQAYKSTLDKPLKEVIFTVIVDDLLIGNVGTEINYDSLYERCKQLQEKGYGFDFISHHGLRDVTEPGVRDDFIKTLKKINAAMYSKSLENNDVNNRRYGELKSFTESAEIVYHEGELYVRATVREKSNIFHENMRYKGAWRGVDLTTHLVERFNDNMAKSFNYKDCQDCHRRVDCSIRYIHDVMDIMETDECIVGLKDIPIPV